MVDSGRFVGEQVLRDGNMSVLLENTRKPNLKYRDITKGYPIDVGQLDSCFGGFTPMSLRKGTTPVDHFVATHERTMLRKEMRERAAAIEAARASEERYFTDESGVEWRYVILDGNEVRIEGCKVARGGSLVIPESIEEKPVVALAADACAYLKGAIEEIVCPDSVVKVGFCAFRGNKSLKRARLSRCLAEYDSGWFRQCTALEDLVLPGQLERLKANLFDNPCLKRVVIGEGTSEIDPGMFGNSRLERIEVAPDNPYLTTDGVALYSNAGRVMVALAVPVSSYSVANTCEGVAKKAFSTMACVESVELPPSVEAIGPFAFSRTGITRFSAPRSLVFIGEKAFYSCPKLTDLELNEGLEIVRDNAFSDTAIPELRLPSTVRELGNPLAANVGLVYGGPNVTFSIAEGSKHLFLDEAGALYRRDDEGLHLVRMMNPNVTWYTVAPETTSIDAEAFVRHPNIGQVILPEGLLTIGPAAFKDCRKLVVVNLPSTLAEVEREAFMGTSLREITIPAGLEKIGPNALVTYGAHHGDVEPSLKTVVVEQGNGRFRTQGGLLLELKPTGDECVVLCTGEDEVVSIPSSVNEIASYAFNGLSCIRELHLSDRITAVGMRGLAVDCLLDLIHIDLTEPIEGHTSLELRFPQTDRSAQQMMLSLSMHDHVNVAVIFENYDNAIINASGFDSLHSDGMSLYEQATRIIERLKDPVFMTATNRSMCDRILALGIEDVCVECAKHDDRNAIDALLDMGYLNEKNLNDVIERVGEVQDAAMTGYLLEAKRLRFQQDAFDFDL